MKLPTPRYDAQVAWTLCCFGGIGLAAEMLWGGWASLLAVSISILFCVVAAQH